MEHAQLFEAQGTRGLIGLFYRGILRPWIWTSGFIHTHTTYTTQQVFFLQVQGEVDGQHVQVQRIAFSADHDALFAADRINRRILLFDPRTGTLLGESDL